MATWGGLRPSYAKLGFDVGDLAQAFSPARALREVAAKRAILARHEPGVTYPDECGLDSEPFPCADLMNLAAVYSGHPDYQSEWKP